MSDEARDERLRVHTMRGTLLSVLERMPQYRHHGGDLDSWALLEEWLKARVVVQTRMLEQLKRLEHITDDWHEPDFHNEKVLHILKRIEGDGSLRWALAEYMATCSDIHEAEAQRAALAVTLDAPDTPPLETPPT